MKRLEAERLEPSERAGRGTRKRLRLTLRRAARAERQVGERTKSERGEDGVVGDAVLGRDAEEGRQLTVRRHGDDHARADLLQQGSTVSFMMKRREREEEREDAPSSTSCRPTRPRRGCRR